MGTRRTTLRFFWRVKLILFSIPVIQAPPLGTDPYISQMIFLKTTDYGVIESPWAGLEVTYSGIVKRAISYFTTEVPIQAPWSGSG